MKITDYQGYEMHLPTSGGKAGKGKQATSTIQVRLGNTVKKQIRFTIGVPASQTRAIQKAKDYAEKNPVQKP